MAQARAVPLSERFCRPVAGVRIGKHDARRVDRKGSKT
jgi:hypothetical protein